MLRAAVLIFAALTVLSLLGLREDVSVLSGTVVSYEQAAAGLTYVAVYFAAVLLGPPLLVTGLARAHWARVARERSRPSE
jgi:hypothetical protein